MSNEIEEMIVDVTTDWFWEGNVVNVLAQSLASKGWKIESQADTHSKERGVDLRASKDGTTLLVEARATHRHRTVTHAALLSTNRPTP
jgi:hypothetical protein